MHRAPLLATLERYLVRHPDERVTVDHIRQFVRANPDCFERTCRDGHVTGSAWIVSADRRDVLLIHHRKLDRWLQPGGHADGDPDALRVALREAREESGIDALAPVDAEPFDLDVHPIPAHGDDPPHLHHDVRYLLVAPPGAVAQASEESHALRWIARARLGAFVSEESLLRMERKATRLLG